MNLRTGEWEALVQCFPGASIREGPGDSSLVEIPTVLLSGGWSSTETQVCFVTPVGYPAAQPDCFWASPSLRLATGAMPSSTAIQAIPIVQTQGLWFSWHLSSWRQASDNILTYTRFIQRRLLDAR